MAQLAKPFCVLFLAVILLALAACQPNGDSLPNLDEPSASNGDHDQNDTAVEGPMTIEGEVMEIMESWPLQLTVNAEDGEIHVALLEETEISKAGASMTPGELRTGQQIRVEGNGANQSITARTIEVLR